MTASVCGRLGEASPQAFALTGLAKSFGPVAVLRDVDLAAEAGEVVALLGRSGSGKTTLLRLLAGFDRPDVGDIAVAGRAVAGSAAWVPPHRRGIGYVPQDGVLFPHLTVAGNVGFALPRGRMRDRRIADMLDLVGLGGLARRMPHELSGGQQQRVAIARVLAPAPGLVLLDEPFNALDADLRRALCGEVRHILKQAGAAALLVTHDRDEAFSFADRIAAMRDGTVAQFDTAARFYREPADLEIARLAGPAVCLDGDLADGFVETVLGRLPALNPSGLRDGAVLAMLRPEQIVEAASGSGVTATVGGAAMRGPLLWLDLDCAWRGGNVALSACWLASVIPGEGTTVSVRVSGAAVVYGIGSA